MSSILRIHLQQAELELSDGARMPYAIGMAEGSEGPRPLVVGLHFGWRGQVALRQGRDFLRLLVEPVFVGTGAVLLGPTCPADSWHHPRAESAVLRLIDHVLATRPVDPDRVVLVGFSLGGMGCWFHAAQHPDRFCAVFPVASVPLLVRAPGCRDGRAELERIAAGGAVRWHEGLRRVPVCAVNSRDDEVIPWRPVADAVAEMQRRGADVHLELLDGVGHYESARYALALQQHLPWLQSRWGRPRR